LFTTLIFVFIFGNLAAISTDGLPQPLFYMTGIVAWNYFADCLTKTSTVFKDNAHIFGKVYFPRLIMPLSIVVSSLVKFAVQFLLLLLVFGFYTLFRNYHPQPSIAILFIPLLLCLMAAFSLGLGMIISSLTTKYRDLSFLVTFGVQLLMYATPVIYPLSAAPEKFKPIIQLNPIAPIIEGMRYALLGKGDVTPSSLLYTGIVTLIVLGIGTVTFNKVERTFMDTV
jgi:lipopolysaccharide transport system permease protein